MVEFDWDEGFWFDRRPDAALVWHCRAACEAGRIIPKEFRERTYSWATVGQRRRCSECAESTPRWELEE